MTKITPKLTTLASVALALSVATLPISAKLDRGGFHIKASAALAKDGHSGRDGGGGGGSSGRGGGDDGGDHDGGGSGRGGGDDGGGDDGGHHGGDDDGNDDNGGRNGAEHVDPATGAKVEVSGDSIEVKHPNGVKEELENGRYEMKDASGRTIVERQATAEDIARMNDLAN